MQWRSKKKIKQAVWKGDLSLTRSLATELRLAAAGGGDRVALPEPLGGDCDVLACLHFPSSRVTRRPCERLLGSRRSGHIPWTESTEVRERAHKWELLLRGGSCVELKEAAGRFARSLGASRAARTDTTTKQNSNPLRTKWD